VDVPPAQIPGYPPKVGFDGVRLVPYVNGKNRLAWSVRVERIVAFEDAK